MSSPRAVLHVGTMKTGTSTLQATLAANSEILLAADYRYLGWPMRSPDRIEGQLATYAPGTNVIISDEGLWHFCGTKRSDTRSIAKLLAEYRTTIIVYFRRPDEYVEAWFSQGLKKGSGSPDILSFLSSGFVNSAPYEPGLDDGPASFDNPEFLDRIDLSIHKRLAYFRDVFPEAEIVVRPYEKGQLAGEDIVVDFFDAAHLDADISVDELERSVDENVSPSADTVLFASLLRQTYDVPEDVLQAFLRTHSPPMMTSGQKRRILRLHEAVAINESMRPSFRDVQATWGGGATDDFFLEWEIDPATFLESDIRDVYDQRVPSPMTPATMSEATHASPPVTSGQTPEQSA